jgi:hypothetical protein
VTLTRHAGWQRKSLPAVSKESTPQGVTQEHADGFLTLDTAPWSEVRIGKRRLGVTPLVSVPLPSGRHTLELRNPELGLMTRYTVQIDAGKSIVRKLGIN